MARIRNTLPDFQRYAGNALEGDARKRSELWEQEYLARHEDVLGPLLPQDGDTRTGISKLVRQLRGIRARAQEAAAIVPGLIEEVEPEVRSLLDAGDAEEPLHVLLVGTMGANALVTAVDGDLAVLHCVEWYAGEAPERVLIAHEDTHAWHRRRLGDGDPLPEDDLAWTAFYEGLAVRVSREVVPDRPEEEYFWYGIEGFEDWLEWCRDNQDLLWSRFRDALDAAEAPNDGDHGDDGDVDDGDADDGVHRFFGAGLVEGRWRTGFFLADELVGGFEAEPAELCRMDVDEARELIRDAVRNRG